MNDFWLTSGWHLLERGDGGRLIPGADFMAAYFHRPELALVEESCAAEIALHEKLTAQPFAAVAEAELAALADSDAADNYRAVLAFRQFLGQYDNLQAAYMAIAAGAAISFPPLFVEQLTQIILREIMNGAADAMQVRAAEILFRAQSVTISDGRIMTADQATVQMQAGQQRSLQRSQSPDEVQIDILTSDNKDEYWQRSDRFDTSVDIAYTQPALDGLARVLESWVAHFLELSVRITPMVRIDDENWSWHVGLDSTASAVLNDLYQGQPVDDERLKRILCLFFLQADDGFADQMKGRPVYLGLAMNEVGIITAKPQNLLVNLPLAG